jgi:hypothetical protein
MPRAGKTFPAFFALIAVEFASVSMKAMQKDR